MSGLHCTMPNGTSAPGKSLASFDVPMNGLTTVAGDATSAAFPAAHAGAHSPVTASATAANKPIAAVPGGLDNRVTEVSPLLGSGSRHWS